VAIIADDFIKTEFYFFATSKVAILLPDVSQSVICPFRKNPLRTGTAPVIYPSCTAPMMVLCFPRFDQI